MSHIRVTQLAGQFKAKSEVWMASPSSAAKSPRWKAPYEIERDERVARNLDKFRELGLLALSKEVFTSPVKKIRKARCKPAPVKARAKYPRAAKVKAAPLIRNCIKEDSATDKFLRLDKQVYKCAHIARMSETEVAHKDWLKEMGKYGTLRKAPLEEMADILVDHGLSPSCLHELQRPVEVVLQLLDDLLSPLPVAQGGMESLINELLKGGKHHPFSSQNLLLDKS